MDAADLTARLLALVVEWSPRSVAELAVAAEGPENEIRSALEALERHGLLDWDAARSEVRPGPRLLRFARAGESAEPSQRSRTRRCGGWPTRAARP